MFTASEFRRIARDKLRGHWGRSVIVTLIVSLICGMSGIYNLIRDLGHMDYDLLFSGNYSDFLAGYTSVETAGSVFGTLMSLALSIAVILFSGALALGHCKYYIDLVAENRQDEVSVIFSRFDIFLKAMGLNLFMALVAAVYRAGHNSHLPLPPCPLPHGGKPRLRHTRGGKHEQGAHGGPQVAAVLP